MYIIADSVYATAGFAMSVKPPRIKVWINQQLERLAPKLQFVTEQPAYQKAHALCQEQWQQHRRRTLIWGGVLLVVIVAWNGWSYWQKMPKAPPPKRPRSPTGVVIGGVGAIAVAGIWAWMFPTLRNARRLDGKDVQH